MRIRHPVMSLGRAVLVLAAVLGGPLALAQVEGTNYSVLSPPQPTQSPGKIEVLEFFSYACPHCAEFYPLVSTWLAMQPKDVAFRRVPVGFERPPWINMQRAYFALQASGDFNRLDGALFAAIHQQQQPLFDEAALADWVGKNGGNAEKFAAAYTSFGINNQTVQADKMAEDYRITGVPTLVVEGKYVALGSTLSELLTNTDKLIAKVRAEHAAAVPANKK
jgi:protein dithiol oxidoreductase (disulfide-forming)